MDDRDVERDCRCRTCRPAGVMAKVKELHRHRGKDPKYKPADDALEGEVELAAALIEARRRAGLSQTQLARRMKTSQSYVARIEGGTVRPSTDALRRFAQATGTRLRIRFEPQMKRSSGQHGANSSLSEPPSGRAFTASEPRARRNAAKRQPRARVRSLGTKSLGHPSANDRRE